MRRTIVVGASVAGVRTAQALRAEGHVGQILVVGAEPQRPHDRPPLSKQFLLGNVEPEAFGLLGPTDDFDLLLGRRATALDLRAQAIEIDGSEAHSFDDLVIATGARAAPSPWGHPSGVHVLRSLDEATRLRSALLSARSLVVVGAGVVGMEIASAAKQRGLVVTVVDPQSGPMRRLVTPDVSDWLAKHYERLGVDTMFGTGVDAIESPEGRPIVTLSDGRRLDSDVSVVAIGSRLNVEWLDGAGLDTSDGIRCDQHGRAHGGADVFAVGDVARWWDPSRGEHRRHEHWSAAVDQAGCVAHNLMHPDDLRVVEAVDYMWSDQFGSKLQLVGHASEDSAAAFCHDGDRWFAVFGQPSGSATGIALFNWPRGIGVARRGLLAQTNCSALADELAAAF